MPQPRQSPSTGRIEPPTAYSRFDDKARNEWIDSLKENIRRGLHPEASPGPSRSPSPYEVTQNAIFAAEVQTLSTEQVAEAGTEDDELFNEEGDDEEVAIDEDEIRELEVDYPPITSVDPDEEADSRNDDLRHGNLADHSGYQTYAEDGYEVNDGEYDKDEGDEEDDRSLRSGDEDEGDDEVQYIGSSDEEPIAQVAGAAEEEDEENKDYENDADKDKAEVYYEGQEEEGYEGEHQPRSIYPTRPGQEVDGYQESEMEEEDFLDNERSPLHHLVCSDHMGSAVQDPYQTQNIYPRLDTFPPSLPVPSSSAITPFADHPDVVNFSENLIDPALLTDIAQQAAEALRAPSGSEARVMVDAAEEEYDERMANEEGEAVGRREYTTPSDDLQADIVSPSQIDSMIQAIGGNGQYPMQDDMQAERRASRPPADEVIEVLSSDGDEEGSTERDDAGGSEDGDDEDGEEEEEEEPVEGEDFEEEEVLEEPEEDSVRFPTRSPFTPGEVIEIDSDSIMDDRSDRYRSPPERVDELEQREDEELYESEPTPEPVEVQQIEDDQMFETDKKPSPSAVYLPDVEVLEPIESDPQVIAVPAIEVEETEAVSIQTNLPVPEIMEAKAAQAIAEISSTKEPVIDSATRPAQEEQEMDDDAEQQQLQVVVELTGSERPAETPCAAELSVEAIREVEPDTTIVTETLGVAIEESDDIPPGNDGSYATRGSESHDQPNQPRVAEHEDYVHESLPEQETACAVALVPVLEEDISEADARARTIEREEVEMPQADDAAASGALPVSDEPVDSGFRDEAIHVPSAELVAFPRSEEHEIYEQGILPAVNATSAILVAELPNPHLAPPDTNMPIPFLFRDPVLKPTPTPSLFVEPPAPPPRPDAVSDVPLREESPVEMPDPGLPPPDSILPGPLRPQDLEPSDSPTPSMVVEPPFYPPVPDSVGANVVRADTPPFLPDARSAPPDTTAETPTLPSEVYNRSPTPSLVVEPADDTTIPTALTTFIRAESPPHTPDSFVAPPDAERIMPEVQHALDPVSLRSESMIVHAPNQQPRPTGEPEPVEFEDEPRMAVQEDETQLPPVHETSADADPPMKLYDQPAEASEPIASRLRHHHGDLGEAQDPATAAPAHQTRSRANSSASLMPTPPVTRSHCFYRKLRVSDDDLTAVVLVPQCTMADAARLHESQWEEAGEPTAEEEKDARPRSMTDLHPLLHPRLAIKLHRIVGKNVFGEGHCFLLYAGVGAFAQAFGHIPSPRKRKAADLQTPMDDDDIAFHVQTTPATKQARTTRSGKRGKSAASPETSATAVRRSQRRNLARSMSKTTSIATDDEEKRDLTPTPVAKSPSVNHSIFAASQRRTRASSIKQAEVTKDHSETEREITPVPSASTRKRKPRQSNPKGELVQPAESSESETEREDLPESSASPTKRKPRQSAAIIEQSVASSGLEQARGDTPMSAIQAAPLPPTSSKRKPRRSAAAEKADLPEDGEHGGDREMTPTPEAAASRRKPRKTGPTRKTADDEAETDRDTTPTKVIKSPPKPISLPAQSTRKRKLRLSIAGAKDVDPWRDLEGVEADEEESSASPAVRETRSMKRRAVDLPGAPDVPVPEGEDAAGDGQIQVETMTIETPRRTRRGIFGKMLAWRDRR